MRFAQLQVTFNLRTSKINEKINVQHWLDHALLKASTEPQLIAGTTWSFGTLKSSNLIIEGKLNGINMNPIDGDVIFLDNNYNTPVEVFSNIRFAHPDGLHIPQHAYLYGKLKCDLGEIFGTNITIPRTHWKSVDLVGHVNCQVGENGANGKSNGLLHFFSNAVLSSTEQAIYENVTFHLTNPASSSITINHANNGPRLTPLIVDGIDVHSLTSDALTSDSEPGKPIVLRGQKQFAADNLKCDGTATVSQSLKTDIINKVDLLALNKSLIRKDHVEIEIASGEPWYFAHPVTIGSLTVKGQRINEVPIDDLFVIDGSDGQSPPPITFSPPESSIGQLHVENALQLDSIDDISFDGFVATRIRKSPQPNVNGNNEIQLINGSLTFENVIVAGDLSSIHSINDCPVADMVMSNSPETQYITGHKHIVGRPNADGVERGAVFVNSPSVLFNVNGIDFSQTYSQSIRLNENRVIASLVIADPFFVETSGGLVIKDTVNDFDVRSNENVGSVHSDGSHMQQWRALNEDLYRANSMQRKQLRYIDKSDMFHVMVNNNQSVDLNEQLSQLFSTWMTIDALQDGHYNGNVGSQFLCPVQYHVRSNTWPSRNLIFHREQPYTRYMTASLHPQFSVHVLTEYPASPADFHNCNITRSHDKRPLSTVYINHKAAMVSNNDIVESINVFYMPDDIVYIVLHIHRKYVALMRGSFHHPHEPWQLMQRIPCLNNEMQGATVDNTVVKTYLFSWQGNIMLIVANSNPIHAHEQHTPEATRSAIVYTFHIQNERFYRLHEIPGDYNIINGMEIASEHESRFILLLGKQYNKFLTTWQIRQRSMQQQQQQQNVFDGTVDVQFLGKSTFDASIRTISMFNEFGKRWHEVII